MNEKEILNIFKQFVEHTISLEEFKQIYENSQDMQNYASKIVMNVINIKYKNNLNNFILNHKWKDTNENFSMQLYLSGMLIRSNISFIESEYYEKQADKFNSVFPDWLNDSALDYLDENFVEKLPEDMKETEKKKLIKAKIKELFKYEKRPPDWVQGTEDWPQDKDGNFLTFRKQKENGERVTYIFVNPKTKEEVFVEEYY